MKDEFCVCPRCGMFEPVLETVSPRTENHAEIVKCRTCNRFYSKDELFRHDMTYEKNFGRDDNIVKVCGNCRKVLFIGTEQEAKGLIIYCPEC